MKEGKVKKPLYKRWWFIGIVVIVLIGFVNSMGDNSAPPSESANAGKTQETKADKKPEEAKPEVTVSSKDLAKAFDDNEIKANEQYKEKIAEISGKITDFGESFGSTYIVLESFDEYSLVSVQCMFSDKDQIAKIAELKKGDNVTVIGTIDGMSMNVTVSNSKFK